MWHLNLKYVLMIFSKYAFCPLRWPKHSDSPVAVNVLAPRAWLTFCTGSFEKCLISGLRQGKYTGCPRYLVKPQKSASAQKLRGEGVWQKHPRGSLKGAPWPHMAECELRKEWWLQLIWTTGIKISSPVIFKGRKEKENSCHLLK